jgi:hypothetical protein
VTALIAAGAFALGLLAEIPPHLREPQSEGGVPYIRIAKHYSTDDSIAVKALEQFTRKSDASAQQYGSPVQVHGRSRVVECQQIVSMKDAKSIDTLWLIAEGEIGWFSE